MDRRSLIQFGLLAGATGVLAPRWAIGDAAVAAPAVAALSGPMAGGVFYTSEVSGRWAKKVATHAPVIETHAGSDGKLTVHVETRHENDGYKHYIVKHVLLNADFHFIDEHLFDPTVPGHPQSEFSIEPYKGLLYVLSVCNVHDTWLGAVEL